MKTLELFNGVLAKGKKQKSSTSPFFSNELGLVIEPGAEWATKQIMDYYRKNKLNGNDLNKTFHKSWAKIQNSTRLDLFIEQITHYLSTYGSNFQDEVYIPNEVLNIPDIKLKYIVIHAYSKKQLIEKCLYLLQSGMALKSETIRDVLAILIDDLKYEFTGKENIKNREAITMLAELYNILPNDPVEFLRYIVYRSTGDTLLIKSNEVINKIKESRYNPTILFGKFGLERLAEIFNRFKPLFLAYKPHCPATINRISKLSKVHHKPMKTSVLNRVTQESIVIKKKLNVSVYSILKALTVCYNLGFKNQTDFVYRIRNGKSWAKENHKYFYTDIQRNYRTLLEYLQDHYFLQEKTFYFPDNILYGVPTSEKMYIGNIPTGTQVIGKRLACGVYWENKWGAKDLDLSGLPLNGTKVGWNSQYKFDEGNLLFSGDLTDARDGAVEYLHAKNGLKESVLVKNNVFWGSTDAGYKIIVGNGVDRINRKYMMDPNNLIFEVKTQSVQKETIIGIFIPISKSKQKFVLLNFGAGHARVSGRSIVSTIATKALYQQYHDPLTFNNLVENIGGVLVDTPEEAEFDFSVDKLQRDSFINVFK